MHDPTRVTHLSIRKALDAQDPEAAKLIVLLANEQLPWKNEDGTPYRDGALTFQKFLGEMRSPKVRKLPKTEQADWRKTQIAALEAPDAEIPLADRLRAHEFLIELWQKDDVFSRSCLIDILRECPLKYGVWRAIKRIFKEAEDKHDTEIYGLIASRFDLALAGVHPGEITRGTLLYLCRRAWRYLRNVGETLPATYADIATDFLAPYPDSIGYNIGRSWIINHIFFHEAKTYNKRRFTSIPRGMQKNRAFDDLWKRSPRPLFNLLERAEAELVRKFTIEALKSDFRASIRDVEPEWVVRLVAAKNDTVDGFVVWVLENVPRFEQAAFRQLGLHDAVLQLLESGNGAVSKFAADYVRTHARDLDLQLLIRLAGRQSKALQKLAMELIGERDARAVGLGNWRQLLELEKDVCEFAAEALRKNFGASELTPDWLRTGLLQTKGHHAVTVFTNLLLELHPSEKLGEKFFTDIIDDVNESHPFRGTVNNFAFIQLKSLSAASFDPEFLKRAMIDPVTRGWIERWVLDGFIKTTVFGVDFLKTISYHPNWESSQWVAQFKKSKREYNDLEFDLELSEVVFEWLGDLRGFRPSDLGLDWLLELAGRSESNYHDFAVDVMIRGLAPAEFANGDARAGCERLWAMMTEAKKDDDPLAAFALKYFRLHHADIALKENGVPVETGAEIPPDFLTFQQLEPLFGNRRKPLRDFALEVAESEFARWAPPMESLIDLCELRFPEVREFVTKALTADDHPDNHRFRLDPNVLTPSAVYTFCESNNQGARALGMLLIDKHPRLRLPEELFRLTESPDRDVRAFVIRTFWSIYRERGTTDDWKPKLAVQPTTGAKARKDAESAAAEIGDGAPTRPTNPPAARDDLQILLRRVLFEIPPGRPPKDADRRLLKPLPNRRAKLSLIETLRDLGMEDREFAQLILPLLREFMGSRGKSEFEACLVAVTRLELQWKEAAA